ncbi:hypothetical protein BSL82_11790 [Tardibacter chloracetimidivorans]|uniref:FAS1-like dehydratase domain-containing protein n=1 Tax=Tardibacter chloracetimidivorans TaxID=1921510 RepID=A0A1L3ZWA0_9SPHN|nr:MaoC family dehydratase N-terminal domain-containing protein [Tardibacter chloracetimidivorans]API59908.1 hypothetical protein BSL82_11790 [Tardibacter chloracetimidivorans]
MLNFDAVKAWPFEELQEGYTRQDAARFARACGVGLPGPLHDREARYGADSAGFHVLPMYAIMLGLGDMWTKAPGTGIDWTKTVHAEEAIRMHGALPEAATVRARRSVDAVYDKGPGRGALMYESNRLFTADGAPIATVSVGTFLLGDGGFGPGDPGAPPAPRAAPQGRAPDRSIELATARDPDPLYLLGPEFVAAVGVPVPDGEAMLRGVCSFGMAGRAAMGLVCDSDPARFRGLGVRYAGPIMTGETIRLDLWIEEEGCASFVMRVVERDVIVLKNGFIEYS